MCKTPCVLKDEVLSISWLNKESQHHPQLANKEPLLSDNRKTQIAIALPFLILDLVSLDVS